MDKKRRAPTTRSASKKLKAQSDAAARPPASVVGGFCFVLDLGAASAWDFLPPQADSNTLQACPGLLSPDLGRESFRSAEQTHLGRHCECDWMRRLDFHYHTEDRCEGAEPFTVDRKLPILQISGGPRAFLEALQHTQKMMQPFEAAVRTRDATFAPIVCPLVTTKGSNLRSKAAVARAMDDISKGAGSRFFYKFKLNSQTSFVDYLEEHWTGMENSSCDYCDSLTVSNAEKPRKYAKLTASEIRRVRANCSELYRPLKAELEKELQFVRFIRRPRRRSRREWSFAGRYKGLAAGITEGGVLCGLFLVSGFWPHEEGATDAHQDFGSLRLLQQNLERSVYFAFTAVSFHIIQFALVSTIWSFLVLCRTVMVSNVEPGRSLGKKRLVRKTSSRGNNKKKTGKSTRVADSSDSLASRLCFVLELGSASIWDYLSCADVDALLQTVGATLTNEFADAVSLKGIKMFAVENRTHLGRQCACDWMRSLNFLPHSDDQCVDGSPFTLDETMPILQIPGGSLALLDALVLTKKLLVPLRKRGGARFVPIVCPLVTKDQRICPCTQKDVKQVMNNICRSTGTRFFHEFQKKRGRAILDYLDHHWSGIEGSSCEYCDNLTRPQKNFISYSLRKFEHIRSNCREVYRPLKSGMMDDLEFVRFVPRPRGLRKLGYHYGPYEGLVAGLTERGVVCGFYLVDGFKCHF